MSTGISLLVATLTSLILLVAFGLHLAQECQQSKDVAYLLHEGFGLKTSQFWRGKVDNVISCAVMCVRRKPCKSINFNVSSQWCELNSGTQTNTKLLTDKKLIYSLISRWPAWIDESCFSRPCTDDEVCVPGGLLNKEDGCSYACLPVSTSKVCPVPPGGASSGRKVGAINTRTCRKGYTGGGTAECKPNGQWDNVLEPCELIYNHSCKTDSICQGINGVCDNGKCKCASNRIYNATTFECEKGIRLVDSEGNPASGEGFLQISFEEEWHYIDSNKWTWQATKVACREINDIYQFGGSFHTTWSGKEQPTSGSSTKFDSFSCDGGETSLDDCTGVTKSGDLGQTVGLTCYDFNATSDTCIGFTDNLTAEIMPELQQGLLLVKYKGVVGAVCEKGWDDKKDTEVACRSINESWKDDNKCNNCPEPDVNIIVAGINCEGKEPHLFFCENEGWSNATECKDRVLIKCKTQ